MTLTGNSTVDATIQAAEATRQGVFNAAGCTQAAANAASVVFYKAVMAANLAASLALDVGNEIIAIQDQLNTSV